MKLKLKHPSKGTVDFAAIAKLEGRTFEEIRAGVKKKLSPKNLEAVVNLHIEMIDFINSKELLREEVMAVLLVIMATIETNQTANEAA